MRVLVVLYCALAGGCMGKNINNSGGQNALIVEDSPQLSLPGAPAEYCSFTPILVYSGPPLSELPASAPGLLLMTGNTAYSFTGAGTLAVFGVVLPGADVTSPLQPAPIVPEPASFQLFGLALLTLFPAAGWLARNRG